MKFMIIFLIGLLNLNANNLGKDKVIFFNDKNFDTMININLKRKFLVLFTKNKDCSQCKDTLNKFYSFSYKLVNQNSEIKPCVLNCDLYNDLCSRFFIKQFPFLTMITENKYFKYKNKFDLELLEIFTENYKNEESENLLHKTPTHIQIFIRLIKESFNTVKIIFKGNNKNLKIVVSILIFSFILFYLMFFYWLYKFIKGEKKEKFN